MKNRKGFTITELVIVIAVIAILAAVLIPTFSSIIKKANDSAALQEARSTYSVYVANVDYAAGETAEEDLVIKVGEKYLAVDDGELEDDVYASADAAAVAAGITAKDGTGNDYVLVEKNGEEVNVEGTDLVAANP